MQYIPIILPGQKFINKHGEADAYIEMNPTLFITEEGEYTLLTRLVNYRKFHDRSFTLSEPKSISKYYIQRGRVNNGIFEVQTEGLLDLDNPFPRYNTYWLGAEDIRFVSPTEIIATIPENNPNGMPRIVRGSLDGSKLTITDLLEPSNTEKNWMPFGTNSVVYSVSPFVVKSIDSDDRKIVYLLKELDTYHGSTNGVPYENGYLFLIHDSTGKTLHRWLYYSEKDSQIGYSNAFTFFPHSYIEFPCSLAKFGGEYYVSLGINDDKAFIVKGLVPNIKTRIKFN